MAAGCATKHEKVKCICVRVGMLFYFVCTNLDYRRWQLGVPQSMRKSNVFVLGLGCCFILCVQIWTTSDGSWVCHKA